MLSSSIVFDWGPFQGWHGPAASDHNQPEHMHLLSTLQVHMCSCGDLECAEPYRTRMNARHTPVSFDESTNEAASAHLSKFEACYARLKDGPPCSRMSCRLEEKVGWHTCRCKTRDKQGGLLRSTSEKSLNAKRAALLACASDDEMPMGITATFAVNRSGDVVPQRPSRPKNTPAGSRDCLTNVLRTVEFPDSSRGGTVEYSVRNLRERPRVRGLGGISLVCGRHRLGSGTQTVTLAFDVDTTGAVYKLSTSAKGELHHCIRAEVERRSGPEGFGRSRRGAHVGTTFDFRRRRRFGSSQPR